MGSAEARLAKSVAKAVAAAAVVLWSAWPLLRAAWFLACRLQTRGRLGGVRWWLHRASDAPGRPRSLDRECLRERV